MREAVSWGLFFIARGERLPSHHTVGGEEEGDAGAEKGVQQAADSIPLPRPNFRDKTSMPLPPPPRRARQRTDLTDSSPSPSPGRKHREGETEIVRWPRGLHRTVCTRSRATRSSAPPRRLPPRPPATALLRSRRRCRRCRRSSRCSRQPRPRPSTPAGRRRWTTGGARAGRMADDRRKTQTDKHTPSG